MYTSLILVLCATVVSGYPHYDTQKFKVGIEYDHSLPMSGGSDRFRHKNNYDPFFVTIAVSAKKGYVISYIDVSATTESTGEVQFSVVHGQTGYRNFIFQLVSNNSEFLAYSYMAYGIREEEYKKVANIVTIPTNKDIPLQYTVFMIILSTIITLMPSVIPN